MKLTVLGGALAWAGIFLGATPAFSFGNDREWQSGWGQGVAEAVVTNGAGNQIYVTCDEGAGRNATGISFMIGGDSPTGDHIVLTFDGADPEQVWVQDGQITSDCRACAGTYDWTIERLKKHSRVHVMTEAGESAAFTLKGATKAIGNCTADFYR